MLTGHVRVWDSKTLKKIIDTMDLMHICMYVCMYIYSLACIYVNCTAKLWSLPAGEHLDWCSTT